MTDLPTAETAINPARWWRGWFAFVAAAAALVVLMAAITVVAVWWAMGADARAPERVVYQLPPGVVTVTTFDPPKPPPPAPGDTAETAIPFGQAARMALDWDVTVTGSEINAKGAAPVEPGAVLVRVSVNVHNAGAAPLRLAYKVRFQLWTPMGGTVEDGGQCPRRIDMTQLIQPGGNVAGDVCFEIASLRVPGAALLAGPTNTTAPDQLRRFLSITKG